MDKSFRSLLMLFRTLGYWTLTARRTPLLFVAWWTCPIVAAGALYNLTTGGLTNFVSGGDINMSSPKGIGIAAGLAMPSLGSQE